MEWLFRLAVLAAGGYVAWRVWALGRPRGEFVVVLERGQSRATSGAVTAGFLRVVGEVAADHGMRGGRVVGVAQGNGTGIRLEFSRHFSPPARQRIRNWWVAEGWRTGTRPGPRPRRRG